jgi:hypothetical protein
LDADAGPATPRTNAPRKFHNFRKLSSQFL